MTKQRNYQRNYFVNLTDNTSFSIDNARKELNSLLVSRENNKRLEELKRRLDYFDVGIVKKVLNFIFLIVYINKLNIFTKNLKNK
jgi:hypothetical protein